MCDFQAPFVPIIYVISPTNCKLNQECRAVPHLGRRMSIFVILTPSTLGYGHQKMVLQLEWARPDLNWRSSPCQGDVITPRPRALWFTRTEFSIWMIRSHIVESSNDFWDLTSTSWLWASATYSLSPIGHWKVLYVLNRAIRFAFQTEPFVFSHGNQSDEQKAGYERFYSTLRYMVKRYCQIKITVS